MTACAGGPPAVDPTGVTPTRVDPGTSAATPSGTPTGLELVRVGAEQVASGLTAPIALVSPPGEPQRRLLVDQVGEVRELTDGGLAQRPFHVNTLSRFTVDADGASVDRESETVLWRRPQEEASHAAGQLAFDARKQLLLFLGDGQALGAQDPRLPNGKVLRFDLEQPNAPPELVASGLRHPWRISHDPSTRQWLMAEPNFTARYQEVNVLAEGAEWGVSPSGDLREGRLLVSDPVARPPYRLTEAELTGVAGRVWFWSLARDASGELYLMTLDTKAPLPGGGAVYRLLSA